jgi:hypothetical protein
VNRLYSGVRLLSDLVYRYTHPFHAIAESVNSAHSLHKLGINVQGDTLPRDPPGLTALANAIRKQTALDHFAWIDSCYLKEATQHVPSVSPDVVLRVLSACLHLRRVVLAKSASSDAVNNLLRLQKATYLRRTSGWQ